MLQSKLSKPLLTNNFTLYPGDTLESTLSVALLIKDGYSGKVITSGIEVIAKAENRNNAILNISGYYCFTKLGDGVITIIVKPTIGHFGVFFQYEQIVDLSAMDEKEPVINIFLIPKPNYPYPKKTTLIRGRVVKDIQVDESDFQVLENALIEAVYVEEQNNTENEVDILAVSRTDQSGEFALALKRIKFQNNKKPSILDIQIKITFATFEKTVLIAGHTLNEGSTLNFGNIQFP